MEQIEMYIKYKEIKKLHRFTFFGIGGYSICQITVHSFPCVWENSTRWVRVKQAQVEL